VHRALKREEVPAVRDLELVDLRGRIRQIDLVVEELELPSLAPAPE